VALTLHDNGTMKRNSVLVLAALALMAFGCSGSGDSSSGTGTPGTDPGTPPATLDRLIEEGDIVWYEDSLLTILNKTRGLSIVSLANPAAPVLESQFNLGGATPVELYLHNGFIAALTSDLATGSKSRLTVIDVRTPKQPKQTGTVVLEGAVSTSRMLGDVLYTASEKGRFIQSVSLLDPTSPRLVDTLTLPLGTQGSHVHATPTTFYVATEMYRDGGSMGECATSSYDSEGCTVIMAVDISSPIGALRLGSSYSLTGLLQDRWGIDASDGILRVLVGRQGWWSANSNGTVNATLRTFKSANAYQLEPLAWLPIQAPRTERVMAVRFDGPRAYVVTFQQKDPLFTIDLSDPSKPFIAGHLESPGWLDFIIPRGDHLLGVGRDQEASGGVWRLQASLYDVRALNKPKLLKRTLFGGNYTTLPDQADNYAKVVRVVDQLGVLLIPHNETSVGYGASAAGRLEVLSFALDTLVSLGQVSSQEPILRAVPLPPSHVATVTESSVGIIQITPELALTASVSLKPTVSQVPDAGIPDTGSRDGSATELHIEPGDGGAAPDGSSPIDGHHSVDVTFSE
jgi:hypothetical protein